MINLREECILCYGTSLRDEERFNASELRELLLSGDFDDEERIRSIIRQYGDNLITLDEALLRILVIYCDF